MAKSSRTDAEAKYAKAQKRAQEAARAMTEAEAETRRIDENTARLKALRLAKEAKDAAYAAANPPPPKRKPTAKAGAKTAAKTAAAPKKTAPAAKAKAAK